MLAENRLTRSGLTLAIVGRRLPTTTNSLDDRRETPHAEQSFQEFPSSPALT